MAVESLLGQSLPPGARWQALWIVASGCTDRTPEIARSLAQRHPEIRLVVENERRGKAAALGEIFRQARGDYLVLLNGDAAAGPGAVAALLAEADGLAGGPFAVMGRPEPHGLPRGPLGSMLSLLWGLHHRLHAELLRTGEGTHLSDELILLPIPALPLLPEEVVNDGAYIGAQLASRAGRLRYAPSARVRIEVPWSFRDHLRQRRRILSGHSQVHALLGVAPTTLPRLLLSNPRRGFSILVDECRETPGGATAFAWLATTEVAALVASQWDRLPPRRNHRLWETISGPPPSAPLAYSSGGRTSMSAGPSDQGG